MKTYKMKHTVYILLTAMLWGLAISGTAWGETGEQGSLYVTKSMEFEDLENLEAPSEEYLGQDGRVYKLSRWEIKEIPGERVSRRLERQVVYAGVEGAEELPDAITITEEMSGVPAEGKLSVRSAKVLKEEWQEGFAAPVTFHSYGADEYEAGNLVIPAGTLLSYTEELGKELLILMGLSGEEYRIFAIEWAGEPYIDEFGQLCRQAMATGQKLVKDYEITYAGDVSWVEPISYQLGMVYEPVVQSRVTVERDGEAYVPEPDLEPLAPEVEKSPMWYWVRSGFVITIAAGLAGILVGTVLLLIIGKRKREEKGGYLPRIKG